MNLHGWYIFGRVTFGRLGEIPILSPNSPSLRHSIRIWRALHVPEPYHQRCQRTSMDFSTLSHLSIVCVSEVSTEIWETCDTYNSPANLGHSDSSNFNKSCNLFPLSDPAPIAPAATTRGAIRQVSLQPQQPKFPNSLFCTLAANWFLKIGVWKHWVGKWWSTGSTIKVEFTRLLHVQLFNYANPVQLWKADGLQRFLPQSRDADGLNLKMYLQFEFKSFAMADHAALLPKQNSCQLVYQLAIARCCIGDFDKQSWLSGLCKLAVQPIPTIFST